MRSLLALACSAAALRAGVPIAPRVAQPRMLADTPGRGFGTEPSPAPAARAAETTPAPAEPSNEQAEAEARGRAMLEKMRIESNTPIPKPGVVPASQLTEEERTPVAPDEGVMPEVVSERMLKRVVPFAALPVLGAFVLFGGFYFSKTQLDLEVPPTVVAYATQALFFASFAGISWGVMSTSWDEKEEGSLLGAEQAKKNIDMMRGGLDRDRLEAAAEFDEEDAAAEGIIMNRQQLRRAEKARKKSRSKAGKKKYTPGV